MQKFLVLQSLWAMQGLRDAPAESSLAADVMRIKAAGFDGFGALWHEDAAAAEAVELATREGLVVEGLCVPQSLAGVEAALARVARFPVHHLNLQLKLLPRTVEEASRLLGTIEALIAEASVPVYIETHRGRLTNDLFFTLDLLDRHPNLKLLADLSHYVVAREMELPIDAETDRHMATVLEQSWAFHGRVAGSEQVQLPLGFAQHQPWIDQFGAWWAAGFASWRRRAVPDAELTFVCELGPQPYAISGPDGRDLTDRWTESLLLKDLAHKAWQQAMDS